MEPQKSDKEAIIFFTFYLILCFYPCQHYTDHNFSGYSDSEVDDINVSERLHELIEEGPANSVCVG